MKRAIWNYYLVILSIAVFAAAQTVISYFGRQGRELNQLIFGTPLMLIVFGIFNTFMAHLIFRPVSRLLNKGFTKKSEQAIHKIPVRCAIAAACTSTVMVIIVTIIQSSSKAPLMYRAAGLLGMTYGFILVIFIYAYFAVSDAMYGIITELAKKGIHIKLGDPGKIYKKIVLTIIAITLPTIGLITLYFLNMDLHLFRSFAFQSGCHLLFMTVVITFFLIRNITVPVNDLVNAANKVKAGDLNFTVPIISNEEIGILSDSFNQMIEELAERDLIKDMFGKYISKEIAGEILKNKVELGGTEKEVTILFLDIRDFTSLSERMVPQDIVIMLNAFFDSQVQIVRKNRGIVNKFLGDGLMALFGFSTAGDCHIGDAVKAALQMQADLADFNKKYGYNIKTGIGVHTGKVIVGNIGSRDRMEYTVIGDPVNLASRIEQATKKVKKDILITENCYTLLENKEEYGFEKIGAIPIKGKTQTITVYGI